jgi:hypothetical protein
LFFINIFGLLTCFVPLVWYCQKLSSVKWKSRGKTTTITVLSSIFNFFTFYREIIVASAALSYAFWTWIVNNPKFIISFIDSYYIALHYMILYNYLVMCAYNKIGPYLINTRYHHVSWAWQRFELMSTFSFLTLAGQELCSSEIYKNYSFIKTLNCYYICKYIVAHHVVY